MDIIAHYRNDYGTNTTLYKQNDQFIVTTDLSAVEKRYSTQKDAEHDLSVSGFDKIEKS